MTSVGGVDNALPCGYCCGAGPLCGSTGNEHDEFECDKCSAIPLSEPHPECLRMVETYMEDLRSDGR